MGVGALESSINGILDVEQLSALLGSPPSEEAARMVVAQVPRERWKELVAPILSLDGASADLLMEVMWSYSPGHLLLLALASKLADRLPRESLLRWADRLREQGLDDTRLRSVDSDAYYLHQELELVELVPIKARRILLIGNNLGELKSGLSNRQPCEVSSIELNDFGVDTPEEAVATFATALRKAIEEIDDLFDVIICLFMLERSIDPWNLVKKLAQRLRRGGTLLARVSNAGNLRILASMLTDGWRYSDGGPLDKQNIRFFDRQGLEGLMAGAGLTVERMIPLADESTPKTTLPSEGIVSLQYPGVHLDLNAERLEELTASEWLVLARLRKPSMTKGMGKRPTVWDVFPFFNELDLLEARLEELYLVVDYFVIVEASLTHRGKPKPLWFAENKGRFSAFADKIVHVVADLSDSRYTAWQREAAQRDAALPTLARANPEDLVLSCDLDEIPNGDRFQEILDASEDGPVALGMAAYYYTLNWRAPFVWRHPKAARARDLPPSLSRLRMVDQYRWSFLPMIENAGWHLTYFGGAQAVHEKLKAFAHSEVDTSAVHQQVGSMIAQGVIHNGIRLTWVEDQFPESIRSRFSEMNYEMN